MPAATPECKGSGRGAACKVMLNGIPKAAATLTRATLTHVIRKSAPHRRFHYAMRPRPFLRAVPAIPVVRDTLLKTIYLIARQNGRPKAKLLKFKPE